MNHGLSDKTIAAIQGVLMGSPQVERAVIYGSRAKGTYKRGSDIDLTLFGAEITDRVMSRIYWELDDLLLPYKIDLSCFADLRNEALIEHILRVGLPIYERAAAAAR
jgi:predicted nucleotidyltransferase